MSDKSYMTLEDLQEEYNLAHRDYTQDVMMGNKYKTSGVMILSRLNLLVYIAKTYYGKDFDVSYRELQKDNR